MALIDLSKFDLIQLKQLQRELTEEIERKTQAERQRVAEEIKRLASSVGMTVEKIMAAKKGSGARRPKKKPKQTIQ